METLQELVDQRRGYKYLKSDGTSPYKGFVYDLKNKKQIKTNLDGNVNADCGEGWNLATLQWILNDTNIMDKIIVEFSIPKKAQIIVPINSNGKFRTDIIKLKKVHAVGKLFPKIKEITDKLKTYKPINPITAEEMPPKTKIKKIMDQVRAQVRAQVWAQVWAQVRAQVWDQVWAQVGAQVGAQVYLCAYYAIKLFMNLSYEHPAFDLIRLGIMVVKVQDKYKVFGKNGKYLGEF